MTDIAPSKYPRIEELLEFQNLKLKPIYTTKEAAQIFGVSTRAILQWIELKKIVARDLPGRGRFFSSDLEEFLENSKKN
jgi:excisionase family DNA binding protein